MSHMLCTIGFSKKSLRQFIKLLKESGVTDLIDVRLNNTSQLSGYAKKDDLQYIMELVGINYFHDISLAPSDELLEGYKKKKISWTEYERRYIDILNNRNINQQVNRIIDNRVVCFLCSEDKPERCHRRLLVNYLKENSSETIDIKHLI